MAAVVLRRSLVLLSLLAATGGAVMACASDGDLNPQPLPPVTDPTPGGDDDDDRGGSTSSSGFGGSSTSGSSSGSFPATPVDAADAGADAADADASKTP